VAIGLAVAFVAGGQAQTRTPPAPTPKSTATTAASPGSTARPDEVLSHGLFNDLPVYRPAGAVQRFVLLLSGQDGLSPADHERAKALKVSGAMVAAIDTPRFMARLAAEGGRCSYPNGALENLGRHLQAYYRLPGYQPPMLVGRGVGGALAYAVLAQEAPGTFASALSIGFCPELPFKPPLCEANALRMAPPVTGVVSSLAPSQRFAAPWTVLPSAGETCPAARAFVAATPQAQWREAATSAAGATDAAFGEAYAQLAARVVVPPPPPASLADLPLIEVPATAAATAPGAAAQFAVLVSGDGGWAGIDKDLAAALAKRGVPVAGFDSLRYFWSARTPEGLATDLDRLIRFYAARWSRAEVLLIGYSQGADVLPFAVNRLPPATRARVALTTLLAPGQKASFEFHVANWIGRSGDKPVAPEAKRLTAAEVLCVRGSEERQSLCPELAPQHARELVLKGGHHFDGDYDKLARLILEAVQPR
jgi:type IV secretory pathway VirJ component